MKTWVLPFSRRNGFEWTIRSRSRWNGVRTPHSSSGRSRPRVSYERTASGDSHRSSRSRSSISKASTTLPAISGIEVQTTRRAGRDCHPRTKSRRREQMARIWLEFARYYVALDPFAFQVPREDGLADWFERETARAKSADQRALVAEVDGVIAGFAAGSIRGLRRTPSISS